ncbi:MAG: 50S ribosomal protein L33 [Alphaproteobacteria bacterium]|nr:50S ribosomal protein L33 [Alphaproteobacteria bacterium]
MAKKGATVKVKLVSTAGTGYYYVTKVNKKTKTEKLVKKKYDPRAKNATTGKLGAHVDFKEDKVK